MVSTVSSVTNSISRAVETSSAGVSATSKSIFERANQYTQKLTRGHFTFPEAALIGATLGILAIVEIPWFMFGNKKN